MFGPQAFLNEVVWCYDTGGRSKTSFPRKHDVILRYAGVDGAPFYYDQVALPRDFSTMHETVMYDQDGRAYQRNIKAGKEYRYYLDKGVLPNDWWSDIQALNPAAKERLGYPTQKPVALLERIIKASSKEGDVVLDPFCGCGTTIAAAQVLKRSWIGIDITHIAVSLIKSRIRSAFGEDQVPHVEGTPTSVSEALALAEEDRYQFQWWALGLVDAFGVERKKGGDRGVDGRLYFIDGPGDQVQKIIVSVKSGAVTAGQVRDLIGAVGNEGAVLGVFITLREPTAGMKREAASASIYESLGYGTRHPKIQILSIAELLRGAAIDYPSPVGTNVTLKQAQRHYKSTGDVLKFPV